MSDRLNGSGVTPAAQVAAKQQLGQLVAVFSFAALCAIFALGPRPDDPLHWWNVYSPLWLWLLMAGWNILQGLYENLLPAAKETADSKRKAAELLDGGCHGVSTRRSNPRPCTCTARR